MKNVIIFMFFTSRRDKKKAKINVANLMNAIKRIFRLIVEIAILFIYLYFRCMYNENNANHTFQIQLQKHISMENLFVLSRNCAI